MAASKDLAEQRRSTGLGELLLRPWPVCSQAPDPAGAPALAAEFLPFVGCHAAYDAALASTDTHSSWEWGMAAVIQTAGSGKTRLAYTHGSSRPRDVVVVARVCDQERAFTPSWGAFLRLARHWESALPHLGEYDRRRVAQSALAALKLLAACHASVVARTLARVAAGMEDGSAPPDRHDAPGAAMRREAALRCLRDGQGDGAVAGLYLQQLACMVAAEHLAAPALGGAASAPRGSPSGSADGNADDSAEDGTLPVAMLDRAAVARFCAQADADLRRQLWPGAGVVLWWDDADALLQVGTPMVFQSTHEFVRHRAAMPEHQRDCFHGLACACSDLKDEHRWLQVLSGASTEVATRVEVSQVSPMHGRVRGVASASHISAEDMLRTLQHFLALDAATAAALRPRLDALRGRPVFFFDDFLPALWRRLHSAPAGTPLDAAGLRRLLLDAADAAALASRSRADGNVTRILALTESAAPRYCRSRDDGHDGRFGRTLCTELHAALCLNGGRVMLGEDAAAEAMRLGLLPPPVAADGSAASASWPRPVYARLHEEPVTRAALEAFGRSAVLASREDPDQDPVFTLLAGAASFDHDRVQGFQCSVSAKGHTPELAFVWHVLRSVLLLTPPGAPGPSLHAVLAPLAAPGFVMPPRAAEEFVVASHGTAGGYLGHSARGDGAGAADFLGGRAGGEQTVMYDIRYAGADVAFETVLASGRPASVVLAQLKQRKGLLACIRAASPAWQHTDTSDQRAALRGDAFEPSELRAAFQKTAAAASTSRRLTAAFRVVFSPQGYQPRVVDMCNALNALPEGSASSPVILCQPSDSAFGRRLGSLGLRAEHPLWTPRDVSGSAALAFLLPQTIDDVTAGRVKRAGSAAVRRAVALLCSAERSGRAEPAAPVLHAAAP